MTYNALEDVYLLDSGRKVKRLEVILFGPAPATCPFQWRADCWPPTNLTQAERQQIATWFTEAMASWASEPDPPLDDQADTRPRLVLLDRSSGALV